MRLWHKDLVFALPREQLLGQWRECCLIAKNIAEKGSPNHILVNPIMNYDLVHFVSYCKWVATCMERRGWKADLGKIKKYLRKRRYWCNESLVELSDLFPGWHTRKYLTQCLANLEEKHDRGGISDDEWNVLMRHLSWVRRNAS